MACTSTPDTASCDFTIVVDGTEFISHREILSSASNYFDALFRSNMRETQEGRVELQGMTSETFAVVLNFIHQRVHGLTADNIDDIWDAANRLDIAIYLKVIEQFIIDNLSIDNLWHFYLKAIDFNSIHTKEGSLTFMKQNYELVFRMKEFLNFPFPLVLSCIESEELNVKTEDSVLESILVWVSHGKYRPGACISPDPSDTGAVCKDVEFQTSEGHSRDVTSTGQSESVRKFGQNCDTRTVAEADETDKPDINFRQHGQHGNFKNEEHTGDVTECSLACDRLNYLAELMSSAKLTLATVSYLRSLLTNPYIIQCPDAYHGIQEALKYKCGVYPLESATLTPLRTNSGKRNALAFVGMDFGLHLYDLESKTFSKIKLENFKGRYRRVVFVVSLGSTLCFVCEKYLRNCPFANHKCRLSTVLLLEENKKLVKLYEKCGKDGLLLYLFIVKNKIFCVETNDRYAVTRSRIFDPDIFKAVILNTRINMFSAFVLENDILWIDFRDHLINQTNYLPVNTYNVETKTQTANHIQCLGRRRFMSVAIHKNKETFLLFSSGDLVSVKRGSDNAVKFIPVVQLWNTFELYLNGAVCYKNELTLFCTTSHVSNWTILSSVPGLFDKINVVDFTEVMWTSKMVPVMAPLSWFE
ncbi:uncharacterized protein LOC131944304 [Physella acuta]|uniref:uncharacterized protein LOC131944304 n=1 Tax=Physella acuta TaxID=109671 RepID=UPI0027DDF2E1|nr:uncharacterized protein LOC131944304 [Physella acuta]